MKVVPDGVSSANMVRGGVCLSCTGTNVGSRDTISIDSFNDPFQVEFHLEFYMDYLASLAGSIPLFSVHQENTTQQTIQ